MRRVFQGNDVFFMAFVILSQAVTYMYSTFLQHKHDTGSLIILDQNPELLEYNLCAFCTK